jgi:hypothetical protein
MVSSGSTSGPPASWPGPGAMAPSETGNIDYSLPSRRDGLRRRHGGNRHAVRRVRRSVRAASASVRLIAPGGRYIAAAGASRRRDALDRLLGQRIRRGRCSGTARRRWTCSGSCAAGTLPARGGRGEGAGPGERREVHAAGLREEGRPARAVRRALPAVAPPVPGERMHPASGLVEDVLAAPKALGWSGPDAAQAELDRRDSDPRLGSALPRGGRRATGGGGGEAPGREPLRPPRRDRRALGTSDCRGRPGAGHEGGGVGGSRGAPLRLGCQLRLESLSSRPRRRRASHPGAGAAPREAWLRRRGRPPRRAPSARSSAPRGCSRCASSAGAWRC